MAQQKAEEILSWREMQPGIYTIAEKVMAGEKKCMKPIGAVILPQHDVGLVTQINTCLFRYEGMIECKSDDQYHVFKCAYDAASPFLH